MCVKRISVGRDRLERAGAVAERRERLGRRAQQVAEDRRRGSSTRRPSRAASVPMIQKRRDRSSPRCVVSGSLVSSNAVLGGVLRHLRGGRRRRAGCGAGETAAEVAASPAARASAAVASAALAAASAFTRSAGERPGAPGLSSVASITDWRRSSEARRNSARPRPSERASSGSFAGPKTRSATTRMTISSGRPMPNTGWELSA